MVYLVLGRCAYRSGAVADSVELGEFNDGCYRKIGDFPAGPNPSWVEQHPSQPVLYVTNEVTEGGLTALRFKEGAEPSLEMLDKVSTGGSYPCHAAVLESVVVSANYGGGNVTACCIKESGGFDHTVVCDSPGTVPEGKEDRQESAHPHQAVIVNSTILVPDLGVDRVNRFQLDVSQRPVVLKSLGLEQSLKLPDGAGPRHIVVCPTSTGAQCIYVMNELVSTLSFFRMGAVDGEWKAEDMAALQEVPLLPEGVESKRAHHRGGSEVLVTPCGGYLIALSRSNNSVVVVPRDKETGVLRADAVNRAPLAATTPRHLALHQDGSTLWGFVACHAIDEDLHREAPQDADKVVIFKIDSHGVPHPHGVIPCPNATCTTIVRV